MGQNFNSVHGFLTKALHPNILSNRPIVAKFHGFVAQNVGGEVPCKESMCTIEILGQFDVLKLLYSTKAYTETNNKACTRLREFFFTLA